MSFMDRQFLNSLQNEHILIAGACGLTGLALLSFLSSNKINKISLYDIKDLKHIKNSIKHINNKECIKKIFSQGQTPYLGDIDRIIISPGVPFKNTFIQNALNIGIAVNTEVELATMLCPSKNLIGVTGTDGKSTVVTLLYHILKQKIPIKDLKLGGNIGTPFISFVQELTPKSTVILELSSYMLEGKPIPLKTACLLNIAKDHLDRYDSFNDYIKAKQNIFLGQSQNDNAIINKDDANSKTVLNNIKSKITFFSMQDKSAYIYLKDNTIYLKGQSILSIKNLPLKGTHKENILAACACALLHNASSNDIETGLKDFRGLEHRCEHIDIINGVTFINDSKATTVQAVKKALTDKQNVILLMGGRNKNLDLGSLKDDINYNVKALILYGESKDILKKTLKHHNTYIKEKLQNAFQKAINIAKEDDIIMLSPACTSFDQFKDYKERGTYFKRLVKEYKRSIEDV